MRVLGFEPGSSKRTGSILNHSPVPQDLFIFILCIGVFYLHVYAWCPLGKIWRAHLKKKSQESNKNNINHWYIMKRCNRISWELLYMVKMHQESTDRPSHLRLLLFPQSPYFVRAAQRQNVGPKSRVVMNYRSSFATGQWTQARRI